MKIRDTKTLPDFYKAYNESKPKYALTYKLWKVIVITYFTYVIHYLLTGATYRHNNSIGELRLVKYKNTKPDMDYGKTIKGVQDKYGLSYNEARQKIKEKAIEYKKYSHVNRETDGWKVVLAWFKKEYKFKFNSFWTIRISRRIAWRIIQENVNQKVIHNLTESKYYYDGTTTTR